MNAWLLMLQNKPIILLHEIDDRHGKFDFDTATDVPEDFSVQVGFGVRVSRFWVWCTH